MAKIRVKQSLLTREASRCCPSKLHFQGDAPLKLHLLYSISTPCTVLPQPVASWSQRGLVLSWMSQLLVRVSKETWFISASITHHSSRPPVWHSEMRKEVGWRGSPGLVSLLIVINIVVLHNLVSVSLILFICMMWDMHWMATECNGSQQGTEADICGELCNC